MYKYMRSPLQEKWKAEALAKFVTKMNFAVLIGLVIALYFISEDLARRGF